MANLRGCKPALEAPVSLLDSILASKKLKPAS